MKFPLNIKAVIFDLDGLLIDSEPYWQKADDLFLKSLGVKEYDPKWLRKQMYGRGQRECAEIYIKAFNLKETVDDLVSKRWNILYSFLMKDLKLMPGAEEILNLLFKSNLKIALATGGHLENKARQILKKLEVDRYFYLFVSGLDVGRSKPFPDIYLETAKRLSVDANECLVLEDAPNGVLSSKAANMVVYGVNADEKMRRELKKAGADRVYRSLSEIKMGDIW